MGSADRRSSLPLLPPQLPEPVALFLSSGAIYSTSEAILLVFAFWRGRALGYRRRDTRCRCRGKDATCWLVNFSTYHSPASATVRCHKNSLAIPRFGEASTTRPAKSRSLGALLDAGISLESHEGLTE